MENRAWKTRQKILDAARREFLAMGYEKASLRRMAEAVGISATAIYRHFEDKESLFTALVEPELQGMFSAHAKHDEEVFDLIKSRDSTALWQLSEYEFMEILDYVYDHYDSFKLLLCCAEGTRLHNFQHELVEQQVAALLEMRTLAKTHGIAVNAVGAPELHLIVSGFFSSIFEMVIHDYNEAEAKKCGLALVRFFNAGISTVLGF